MFLASLTLRSALLKANLAVFNSVEEKGAATDVFPGAIKIELPNSHRFGQKIADLADPLGIIPYGLRGEGPKKALASGEPEGRHTIFLFDEESAGDVFDAYAGRDMEGRPVPAVYVADRYGELAFASEGAHGPEIATDVLELLTFVAHSCPECNTPAWGWEEAA